MYIGEMARKTGCSIEIIRYYEKRGLLARPARTLSGYRVYDQDQLERLRFIKRSRALGFGLESIAELISLSSESQRSCQGVDQIARRHLTDIRARIASLSELAKELGQVTEACAGGRISKCRILRCLGHSSA